MGPAPFFVFGDAVSVFAQSHTEVNPLGVNRQAEGTRLRQEQDNPLKQPFGRASILAHSGSLQQYAAVLVVPCCAGEKTGEKASRYRG
jgi:hypothetical protein